MADITRETSGGRFDLSGYIPGSGGSTFDPSTVGINPGNGIAQGFVTSNSGGTQILFGEGGSYGLRDYTEYAVTDTFGTISEQVSPFSSISQAEAVDLYSSKGKIDPESISPTQIADEAYKSVLNFGDTVTKQFGLFANQQLKNTGASGNQLADIIEAGVSALLGGGSGAFSFDAFSIAGSVLSAVGLGSIGGLIGGLGQAFQNMQTAKEKEDEVLEEVGKNVAAGLQATTEIVEQAEGTNITMSNLNQLETNVSNIKANASINEETPLKTVAAGSFTQTSTDYILAANFYKSNHSLCTINADNAFNVFTRHRTLYATASSIEITAQKEIIASNNSDYADFRWTQTGQNKATPIAGGLGSLIGNLFQSGGALLPGVSVDMSTYVKVNTAKVMNINYGGFYSIDGFVFINSGLGQGMASLPPKQVPNIKDLTPTPVSERPEPNSPISVNDKTYETLYSNSDQLENVNLGQIITDAVSTAESLSGNRGGR